MYLHLVFLLSVFASTLDSSQAKTHSETQNTQEEIADRPIDRKLRPILIGDETVEFFSLESIKKAAEERMSCYTFYEDYLKSARIVFEKHAVRKQKMTSEEAAHRGFAREQKTIQSFKNYMKHEDPSCRFILTRPKNS